MIILKKKNFAVSKLRYAITAIATQLTVLYRDGSKFPQGRPFRLILWNQP